MESFKWTIEIDVEVSRNWVEDGFDLSDTNRLENIEQHIKDSLPYAYQDIEITAKAKVKKAPAKALIKKAQGY
ncbi:MAG: hypothetical protein CMH22_06055 [Methylophaga sp.]|nr:hypothetical protein [Methylophaga sp.]|tara:strand:+ start:56787 stop:57005 length:219 start_codon:yes stop_codon:yes gene_type:complete